MYNIFNVSGFLIKENYHKRILNLCFRKKEIEFKNFSLSYVYTCLHYFGFLSDYEYAIKFWDFWDRVKIQEEILSTLQKKLVIKKVKFKTDTENSRYLAYCPDNICAFFFKEYEVITLQEMQETNGDLIELLNKNDIKDYKNYTRDKSLYKHASASYDIVFARSIKRTKIMSVLTYLYTFSLLLGCSYLITIMVLSLTVPGSNIYLINILIYNNVIFYVNFWPVVVVIFISYFVFNRVWLSISFTSLLFFILVEINRFKIFFRDDPFVFSDIIYVKEAANMSSKYQLFIDNSTWFFLIAMMIVIVLSYILSKKKIYNVYVRMIPVIILASIFTSSYEKIYFDKTIYADSWNKSFGSEWKDVSNYTARGFNYSFLRSIKDSFPTAPENYDKDIAANLMEQYETEDLKDNQKVNIISIMLEGYNDFTAFESSAIISEEPYQYYNEIKANSYAGNLYTNIFAAGTIATERSFLTGYTNSTGDFKFNSNSYVQFFNDQDYFTEAMHPCYGWFYNRRNVNEQLGFQNFYYQENKFSTYTEQLDESELYGGSLLMDSDFFDFIIDGYEEANAKNQKYFNFSVTYQNHGPYSTDPIWEKEYLQWQEGYTEAEYNMINNYLNYIAETDKALKKLYDYVNLQPEPIILIFFGDHNPYMGENNSGYELMGINFDLNTIEGAQNYYQTPYVIHANDVAKQQLGKSFVETGNTVSPMFLMNEFFDYAGIKGSSYAQYLSDLKKTYDVLGASFVKQNGKYVLRSDVVEDPLLQNQTIIEYYEMNDKLK